MKRQERLYKILSENLNPTQLFVIDDSHKHAGHLEQNPKEKHFRVEIESPLLEGKPRVEAHRLIHELLSEELKTGLHALSIRLLPKKN